MAWRCAIVYLTCSVRLLAGPTLGFAAGLTMPLTMAITVAGSMSGVVGFTYLGSMARTRWVKHLFGRKVEKVLSSPRFTRIWVRYGILGVGLLAPVILSPPGGALILAAIGGPRPRALISMLAGVVLWTVLYSCAIYLLGMKLLPPFKVPILTAGP